VNIRESNGQPIINWHSLYGSNCRWSHKSAGKHYKLGEGIRIRPILFNNYLHLSYSWLTSNILHHKIFFQTAGYQSCTMRFLLQKGKALCSAPETTTQTAQTNALLQRRKAQECFGNYSRPRGNDRLDFSASLSMTPGDNLVPFYFQPTIGGLDINGNPSFSSYQDFRFREPKVIFFRQSLNIYLGPTGFPSWWTRERWANTR